jgi:cell division transport system permease protein
MKLVGASWGFIRKPFITDAILVGLIAAFLSCVILGCGLYALYWYEPGVLTILTWREIAITGVSVFLFGMVITAICASISVNKFLRMKAGELYKI